MVAASAKVARPAAPAKVSKAAAPAKMVKPATRAKVTAFPSDPGRAAPMEQNEGTGNLPQRKAEPLIEGFFIARIAGEDEARRHGLTEASSRRASLNRNGRGAAEVSASEGDDRLHALARDPETLFLFWDFPQKSRDEAARGLRAPRAVLRVFEGDQLVREIEFTPESRSFYLHHLRPGHRYRVEAHFVGLRGHSQQIGFSSNIVELPGRGNLQGEVRFMRLPWDLDLRQAGLDSGGVHLRSLDPDRARELAAQFDPEVLVRPKDASSDRRSWLFSPSGRS
jgi:hypothetical protein